MLNCLNMTKSVGSSEKKLFFELDLFPHQNQLVLLLQLLDLCKHQFHVILRGHWGILEFPSIFFFIWINPNIFLYSGTVIGKCKLGHKNVA